MYHNFEPLNYILIDNKPNESERYLCLLYVVTMTEGSTELHLMAPTLLPRYIQAGFIARGTGLHNGVKSCISGRNDPREWNEYTSNLIKSISMPIAF